MFNVQHRMKGDAMAMGVHLEGIKNLADGIRRLTRYLAVIGSVGYCVWLSGCGETRAPAPDVTLRFFARDAGGNVSMNCIERYHRVSDAPMIAIKTERLLMLGPKQHETVAWVCQQHCGRFRVTVGEGSADQDLLVAEGEAVTGQLTQTVVDSAQLHIPQTRLWVHVTSDNGVQGAASLPLAIDRQPPQVHAWPAGGTYGKPQDVNFVADESATIHYTMDGAEPTRDATVYTEALRLSTDTTLRFLAVDRFGNVSSHGSENYRIRKQVPAVA
jgi:hypothetical protein